jgi:glycosyltransferase involved in cell wall biosynthesis
MSNDLGVYEVLSKAFNVKVVYKQTPTVCSIYIKDILHYALKANLTAKRGETIFSWGGPLGTWAWLIGRLLGLKRKYFSQNLIFREKATGGRKYRIMRWLYGKALRSYNFIATVNAPGLVDYYAKQFNCPRSHFAVIYDSMYLKPAEEKMLAEKQDGGYVFFGGSAARDVPTFLKLVENLPEVKFMAVVKEHMITPEMSQYNNLEVFCDIPEEDFYSRLCDATVCCIPLDSKAPCGLYTMQKAIMLHTPIVSTDTSSMRTIVPDDSCGYLLPMGDVEGLKSKLTTLLRDKNLRTQLADAALANFDKFKPENVGKRLVEEISSL